MAAERIETLNLADLVRAEEPACAVRTERLENIVFT